MVYYVTPHTPNPDCPSGEPCLTINEYAQGNHFDGDDNITLLFLNGEHNLTAQEFTIAHKTALEMAPNISSVEVMVHLSKMSSILVLNIWKFKFWGLKITSQTDHGYHNNTPNCVSISDVGILSVTGLSVEYCQLSLHRVNNANINKLHALKIQFSVSVQANHTTAIANSEFHSSRLYIVASAGTTGDTMYSNSILQIDSMTNSLGTVNVQNSIIYGHNTSFSQRSVKEDGIQIATFDNAQINTLMKNCSIVGNHRGLGITSFNTSHIQLTVDSCYIADNGDIHSLKGVGGIEVTYSDQSVVNVNVTSTILSNNVNSNLGFFVGSGISQVTVYNSTIRKTSRISPSTVTGYGCGMFFALDGCLNHECMFVNVTNTRFEDNKVGLGFVLGSQAKVNISKSHFINNSIYAMYIVYAPILQMTITETVIAQNGGGIILDGFYLPANITVEDSVFDSNIGVSLGGDDLQFSDTKMVDLKIRNVTFFNNTNPLPNAGIIQVDGSIGLSIEDSCVFRNNHGTSVWAIATIVTLSGVVHFMDNIAYQGGAISLLDSKIILQSVNHSDMYVLFENNTALTNGGAINIMQATYIILSFFMNVDDYTGSSCFFDIQGVSLDEIVNSTVNLTIVFSNNIAVNGGLDVFGATPNSHCWALDSGLISTSDIQDYIFKMSSDLSTVSSNPKRVCLCDSFSQVMCANYTFIFHNTKRYPGEVFSLPLVVVGFEFGTVTGPVYANLLPTANNSKSTLGSGQHVQQATYNGCTPLEYTVNSYNPMEVIVLATNTTVITQKVDNSSIFSDLQNYNNDPEHVVPYSLLTVPVYIEVTLLNCPPGFTLSETGRCDCITALKDIGINNCSIHDSIPYITRSGNEWIKPLYSPDGILSSKYCPFEYCKYEQINLNLNDSDKQCVLNHTGILCGACPSSLSLAIGSSRCLECRDDYHILLLIAFAAAGVLLVLFIKILDVTVTIGTINGLNLYANIIWANQSVLFPPQSQTSPLLQFLKVFIAWLNLDLGIETCFIQHLDGYWKTWLQFVFPAYIWLIAGLIVLVARYSTRATGILGTNTVPVLATLFLLSYAKLLRTVLIILEFSVLHYPDGQKLLWSFDGNVPYFGLKHSILFVVAVLFLLLGLPYMFVLLLIQCLRKYSNLKLLQWINKLYPLFDSYMNPFKAKHHYWIGLGLLARLFLLLTSAITLTTLPYIVTVLISIVAFMFGLQVLSVYKQWQLSMLECCFLLNMAVFSSGAPIIELQGGNKDWLACTSLGIAFILFLAIIVYHVWRRVRSFKRQRMNGYVEIDGNVQTQPQVSESRVTYQEVSVPELREPLLESVKQESKV